MHRVCAVSASPQKRTWSRRCFEYTYICPKRWKSTPSRARLGFPMRLGLRFNLDHKTWALGDGTFVCHAQASRTGDYRLRGFEVPDSGFFLVTRLGGVVGNRTQDSPSGSGCC